MRELTVKLGDKELTLVANFKAASKIAKEVADPLFIAREAMLELMMLQKGINYTPKWNFTVENIPLIIHIAVGEKKTLQQIQDLVFEAGFNEARAIVVEYLSMIVGPRPEETIEADEDEEEGN